MRRAVILHGTDATPDDHWVPWLKAKFEAEGYEVWAPQLPECHTPNRLTYNDFLFDKGWDFTNNIVIGHSSGAVEILNLLMDVRLSKVKLAVMVGVWAGGLPTGYKEGNMQFVNLFPPEGFDFALIKSKADKLAFLHGDNDPFCPLEQAKYLSEQLDASLTVVPGGAHFGSSGAEVFELPELWQIIGPEL